MFMNRRIHAWNETGRVKHYYNYFWAYLIAVSGLAVVTLFLFIKVGWVSVHTSVAWILLLVGGSLLISTVNQVVIPGLNLLGYRGSFVSLSLATTAMSLMASIAIVIGFTPSAENWICGLLAGQLIFAAVGWKTFFGKLKAHEELQNPTQRHLDVLLGFAWPIAISVGLTWTQTQSYRFMMESSLGLNELGLFAAGYGISAGIIAAFESVFATYLQPVFYKNITNATLFDQSKAWGDYADTIFPSLILVGAVILACAPELTHAMLGSKYWSSSQFIIWGVVAELARVASGVYGMIAHARMKTRLLLLPSMVGATLSLTLIWLLIPLYGSNGVGAALMISSLSSFVLTIVFTRKELAAILSGKMLISGGLMGVGLILLSVMLRWLTDENMNFISIVMRLTVVGIVFLGFQYVLIRPMISWKRSILTIDQ